MKIPKELADKVELYQQLTKQEEMLYNEVRKWLVDETDAEGIGEIFITDTPTGSLQNDDEYCDQACHGEDWFTGNYYHQIEGSNKYVGYGFDI